MERGCYYSYTQKGDKQGCNNYRGISFLNTELHTYKIYSYPQDLKMSVISDLLSLLFTLGPTLLTSHKIKVK